MQESYGEGVARHAGPESCAAACEGGGEALTGEEAGRVLSRENRTLRDADAVGRGGRRRSAHRQGKGCWDPARSKTPSMSGHTSRENRESPWSPVADGAAGRIGKSKDTRR